jgi:hypothetical protein
MGFWGESGFCFGSLGGGVAPGSFLDVATRAVVPSTGRPFPDMAIINQA